MPSHPHHPTLIRFDLEGCGHQSLGVGLFWVIDDFGCWSGFDHLAFLHDDDFVADGTDDLKVVADKHIGEVVFLLQVAQEFDNLSLDRHVEGRGGFVQNNEFGF